MEQIPEEETLRAEFMGQAYRFGEAKRQHERRGSWDSLKTLDKAANSVDKILDRYNDWKLAQEVILELRDGARA